MTTEFFTHSQATIYLNNNTVVDFENEAELSINRPEPYSLSYDGTRFKNNKKADGILKIKVSCSSNSYEALMSFFNSQDTFSITIKSSSTSNSWNCFCEAGIEEEPTESNKMTNCIIKLYTIEESLK